MTNDPRTQVSEHFLGKVPPHDREAEISVLGAALIASEVLDEVFEIVRPSDFYTEAHEVIFSAMMRLHQAKKNVDVITLSRSLEASGELETAGGRKYLSGLMDKVVTVVRVQDHARIIANAALCRTIAGLCMDTLQRVYTWEIDDAQQYAMEVLSRLDKATEERTKSRVVDMGEGLKSTLLKVDEEIRSPRSLTGVSTGYYDLDNFTQGLQPQDLIILAGRPSMGKTALALNIAMNAARHEVEFVQEHGGTVRTIPIFSLEMSTDRLIRRQLAIEAGIPSWRLMNPKNLSNEGMSSVLAASEQLHRLPIKIDDTDSLNVSEVVVRARRMNRRNRLLFIIIDYLQIMRALPRRGERYNRDRELGEITGTLKGLAKELEVPILLLSQLNRSNESRQDKRPQLQDLRESGAIEQDADLVTFIHREAYYDEDANRELAEVIIRKHRNGPLGTIKLRWEEHMTRFSNTAEADLAAEAFVQEGFSFHPADQQQ